MVVREYEFCPYCGTRVDRFPTSHGCTILLCAACCAEYHPHPHGDLNGWLPPIFNPDTAELTDYARDLMRHA